MNYVKAAGWLAVLGLVVLLAATLVNRAGSNVSANL